MIVLYNYDRGTLSSLHEFENFDYYISLDTLIAEVKFWGKPKKFLYPENDQKIHGTFVFYPRRKKN